MGNIKQIKWSGRSRGGSLGHLCFILTIRYLGIRAAYALLFVVVPYFVPFSKKSSIAIWNYNRKILKYGKLLAFIKIFKHYYLFGQTIIDKVAIVNGNEGRYKFDFDNYESFLEVLNSGCGVVMIGAHVGTWEVGAPFFYDYGKKINIVMYDVEYQKIKEAINKHSRKNYKIIALENDSIESIIKIKCAIDSGEYVCFQGDRYISEKSTLEYNFMGGNVKFPAGPFLIASRMHVPVVFYFATKEPNFRYKFHFVIANNVERKKDISIEQQLLNEYAVALENIVRKYPQQWFNFYKYWD
ncbi:MAG: acyltransferase [Bacteroidales bacterium]